MPELFDFLKDQKRAAGRSVALGARFSSYSQGDEEDLIAAFIGLVFSSLDEGVSPKYVRVSSEENLGGAFDIGNSIKRFASRGIYHRSVRKVSKIERPNRLEAVLAFTVHEIACNFLLSIEELKEIHRLKTLIGGVQPFRGKPDLCILDDLAYIENEVPDSSQVGVLMKICRQIIQGSTVASNLFSQDPVRRTSFNFFDTELLWEWAISNSIQKILTKSSNRCRLHPLRGVKSNFISILGPNVDPDCIIYSAAGNAIAIVDAKSYSAKAPTSADVYQMYSYASHLHCDVGIIMYLDENSGWERRIMDSSILIFAVGIPIVKLKTSGTFEAHLRDILQSLNIT
ncbi:hypothetical protein QM797_14860 [Rhodococcus sp. IEGM 1381]|uniref:hypothetical protein n=1 Tax=Rhodococcus sp. IEGM 1381 TaxID=3047085 RepID=UPI0024B6B5C0|nr:hypothetical protein [Rhodococcus sp. IEGM 1381]MDI9896004.1 hypothetical protein [Rhodococcus sp. IEGM 1381]